MALLINAQGRRENQPESGYTRIFGQKDLGSLISRIQATIISAGTELERIIWERVKKIDNLDEYLTKTPYPEGVFIANKGLIKQSKICKIKQYEPDFLIFETKKGKNYCHIMEIKDGDQFDTKKAAGEKQHLVDFKHHISSKIQFAVSIHLCCFHAKSRKNIVSGLKKKFLETEAMTGSELCDLLRIDYQEIMNVRKEDQDKNLKYFIEEFIKIKEIRSILEEKIKLEK